MASDALRDLYRKIYDLDKIIRDDYSSIERKISASNDKNTYLNKIKQLEEEEGIKKLILIESSDYEH